LQKTSKQERRRNDHEQERGGTKQERRRNDPEQERRRNQTRGEEKKKKTSTGQKTNACVRVSLFDSLKKEDCVGGWRWELAGFEFTQKAIRST
jgi:uncharacterized membrane protein